MLTHFVENVVVFAPFVLPQNNCSFDSGKPNGVMPLHVMRDGVAPRRNVVLPSMSAG